MILLFKKLLQYKKQYTASKTADVNKAVSTMSLDMTIFEK